MSNTSAVSSPIGLIKHPKIAMSIDMITGSTVSRFNYSYRMATMPKFETQAPASAKATPYMSLSQSYSLG